MAASDTTLTSAPDRTPPVQPSPFGCRLLVSSTIISLVVGGAAGAGGAYLFGGTPNSGQPADPDRTITVEQGGAIVEAVNQIAPSVVSITSRRQQPSTLFGTLQQEGAGTGFIITRDGLIGTNRHVVEGIGTELTVITAEGQTYDAEVEAVDPLIDFALIKIGGQDLPVAPLGNSDELAIGQQVVALGNALGQFENTVTAGVLSAKERSIDAQTGGGEAEALNNLLQTDAAINPGNSGGPLVNLAGQVIGVNTAVASGGAQGIGFAIPINRANQAIQSFLSEGRIIRPSLGVRYVPLTPAVAQLNNLSVTAGAWLVDGQGGEPAVVPGSPAARAGLRTGDIITKINELDVGEDNPLASVISQFRVGQQITLTIVRDGQTRTVTATLAER